MRILKPEWVTHANGRPIYSIDVQPGNARFATGGQGQDTGCVVIWNLAPVVSEVDELNVEVPKMLCIIQGHSAAVNCVRWSRSGSYLASAGDDRLIMIWANNPNKRENALFGMKNVNKESWQCFTTLRGHKGDIFDVSWSPRDRWLATASMDFKIIIWDAIKAKEQIAILSGHTGFVKGIAWDPVGKYLSSQSEDKSLKIWRTFDWQVETTITDPYKSSGTTHGLRHDWSPEGKILVTSHSINNGGPTAKIIERDGWKFNLDIVGHRQAVIAVRFYPYMVKRMKSSSRGIKCSQMSLCALGSRDHDVSVWILGYTRPLVVIRDIFSGPVLDISWSSSARFYLMACSYDGTVMFADFDKDEIGQPLNEMEKDEIFQKLYGTGCNGIMKEMGSRIIENPILETIFDELKGPPVAKKPEVEKKAPVKLLEIECEPDRRFSVSEEMAKQRAVETTMVDGKRRIRPILLQPVDAKSEPETSISIMSVITKNAGKKEEEGESVEMVETCSKYGQVPNISNGCKEECPEDGNGGGGSGGILAILEQEVETTLLGIRRERMSTQMDETARTDLQEKDVEKGYTEVVKNDKGNDDDGKGNEANVEGDSIEVAMEEAIEENGSEESDMDIGSDDTGSSESETESDSPFVVRSISDKGEEDGANEGGKMEKYEGSKRKESDSPVSSDGMCGKKRIKVVGTVSSDQEEGEKRKKFSRCAFLEDSDKLEKKAVPGAGKGKPKKCIQANLEKMVESMKGKGATDVAEEESRSQQQQQQDKEENPWERRVNAMAQEKISKQEDANFDAKSGDRRESSVLVLPPMKCIKENVIIVEGCKKILIVNDAFPGMKGTMARIKYIYRDAVVWDKCIGSNIIGCVANEHVTAVAARNKYFYFIASDSGKHTFPPMMLRERVAHLCLTKGHLLYVTCDASLTLWNLTDMTISVSDVSISHLLISDEGRCTIHKSYVTEEGVIMLTLTSGKSFMYSTQHKLWLVLGDAKDLVVCNSFYSMSQNAFRSADKSKVPLYMLQTHGISNKISASIQNTASEAGLICTLSFLELQLSSAAAVNSPLEYRSWLMMLVQFLLKRGEPKRLRSICEELLGPSGKDGTILGVSRHELLREVLSEVAKNPHASRLYNEFNDQLSSN